MENPFFDVMYPEDVTAMVEHVNGMKTAADTEVREIEYRMVHADGDISWFRDRSTVFKRDGEGNVTEKTCIAQDITQKKNAQEKIKHLNKTLIYKKQAACIFK